MDTYLLKHQNAMVILTGDFNPTSTGLHSDSISRPNHSILLDELRSFNFDQTLFFWIHSFLTNRTQEGRVGSSLSSWKQVNGGVPQGTKLGLIPFAVMVNKLLMNWHMRTKYVDDTTAFEIIPRNSSV